MTTNRLIEEKSPYLLQHAHNPVDWHPWSEEAFARARAENKPVFLSIGYATCHWCHVMERESFEHEEAARHLNETFVCIKVDREERPDVDAVYMSVCQMLTGSGGWPLTIFMTPEKEPFFAGTYLPRNTRFGRPGVIDLCRQVKTIWSNNPQQVRQSAAGITQHLQRSFQFASSEQELNAEVLDRAYTQIARSFDPAHGGFEPAPKFPTPHRLRFLLRCWDRSGKAEALDMVRRTIVAMRHGGVWDHVGHGFHRYSTDAKWLLPHFEKMLYDQALMAAACLETHQASGEAVFARTAEEIFTYVLRDMTDPGGGFYSAEDADSEGEEGRFYVWTPSELRRVLGPQESAVWERVFHCTPEGNFLEEATRQATGANILHLTRPLETRAETLEIPAEEWIARWEKARRKLFAAREKRVRPLRDDKVLTDWNGLMIAALAMGGRILERAEYTAAAERAARFISRNLMRPDGGLWHRFRDGQAAVAAYADDYAGLIWGLIELYRSTFEPSWLERAAALQDRMLADFWDEENGGFFLTAAGSTELPVRPKELQDSAVPSANSTALSNLLHLGRLTGEARWERQAQSLVQAFSGTVGRHPTAFTHFLTGLDFALRPGQDVVVAGRADSADTRELVTALGRSFAPGLLAHLKSDKNGEELARVAGFTAALDPSAGNAVAHLCIGGSCRESVADADTLWNHITSRPSPGPADPEHSDDPV